MTAPQNDADRRSLDELGRRIEAARARLDPRPEPKRSKYAALSQAWRMVVELVSGLAVGLVLGYALDRGLGTMPVFLLILGGFGFAAGVKMMMVSAKRAGG